MTSATDPAAAPRPPLDGHSTRARARHKHAPHERTRARKGFRVLYRGFWPTLVGAGPRGAIGFGIFETLKPLTKQNELLRDRPGERPTTTAGE